MELSSTQKRRVGHWKLSKSSFNPATKRFTDSSPYSNHGTGHGTQLGGGPTFQADHMGTPEMTAPFNGGDDYISFTNDTFFDMELNDLSIVIWVKIPTNTQSRGIIGKHKLAGVKGRYGLCIISTDSHKVKALFAATSGSVICTSSINIDDNVWHLCVVSYDRTGLMSLYVDNVLDGFADISAYSAINMTSTLDFDIGIYRDGTGAPARFLNGNVDDAMLYKRVLTSEERTFLYESYHPGVKI